MRHTKALKRIGWLAGRVVALVGGSSGHDEERAAIIKARLKLMRAVEEELAKAYRAGELGAERGVE